jgi:hypothetical protein
MLVKTKQNERWRRRGRRGFGGERSDGRVEMAAPVAQEDGITATSHERRHTGPSEDRALYTCECGCAFKALVTTSVGCPHCGTAQAW